MKTTVINGVSLAVKTSCSINYVAVKEVASKVFGITPQALGRRLRKNGIKTVTFSDHKTAPRYVAELDVRKLLNEKKPKKEPVAAEYATSYEMSKSYDRCVQALCAAAQNMMTSYTTTTTTTTDRIGVDTCINDAADAIDLDIFTRSYETVVDAIKELSAIMPVSLFKLSEAIVALAYVDFDAAKLPDVVSKAINLVEEAKSAYHTDANLRSFWKNKNVYYCNRGRYYRKVVESLVESTVSSTAGYPTVAGYTLMSRFKDILLCLCHKRCGDIPEKYRILRDILLTCIPWVQESPSIYKIKKECEDVDE